METNSSYESVHIHLSFFTVHMVAIFGRCSHFFAWVLYCRSWYLEVCHIFHMLESCWDASSSLGYVAVGFYQPLPDLIFIENQETLHALDRRGNGNQDWITTHRAYIDVWTNRRVHVQDGTVVENSTYSSDAYHQWYQKQKCFIFQTQLGIRFLEGLSGW